MQAPNYIANWLVLGPIFNPIHQTAVHSDKDGHPGATEIVRDIDDNPLPPLDLTNPRLLAVAPKDGDSQPYGNGKYFPSARHTWRALSFNGVNWADPASVQDDIHLSLRAAGETPDPANPLSFLGKHHALVFFLAHFRCPDERKVWLHLRSDDAIRLWLNGEEQPEPLRFLGNRDITVSSPESSAEINLRRGWNILLAAVAETHVEWGFSARLGDVAGLVFCQRSGGYLKP